MIIPETNARGWYLWVLLDMDDHQVMRREYKSEKEAEEDNRILNKNKTNRNWLWVPNDSSKIKTI